MGSYLKYIGAAAIAFAAVMLGRLYRGYVMAARAEEEGMLGLLLHIKGQVGCYLSYGDGLVRGFRCAALSDCGFLEALADGRAFSEAFELCEEKMYSSEAVKEIMLDFCNNFGKGYRDAEMSRLSDVCERLRRAVEKSIAEQEKNLRVARTLIAAAALGIIILLI